MSNAAGSCTDNLIIIICVSLFMACFIPFSYYWLMKPKAKCYLSDCLSKGIPNMTVEVMKQYGNCCQILIDNKPVIVTSNPSVISYIFQKNQLNYIERFCHDDGLKVLGMFEKGVIWNNDNQNWEKMSKLFTKAINEKTIKRVALFAMHTTKSLMEQAMDGKASASIDILAICRQVTFRSTLFAFFGIPEITKTSLNESNMIAAIVDYFKAWEYLLIRPSYLMDKSILLKHTNAILRLQAEVRHLLSVAEETNNQTAYFYQYLSKELNEEERSQIALEMLLAGTDTSSVSTFYAILALAEHQDIHEKLTTCIIQSWLGCFLNTHTLNQDQLSSNYPCTMDDESVALPTIFKVNNHSNESAGIKAATSAVTNNMTIYYFDYFDHFVKETLRCKPVGPIVIRQAVRDDVLPNGMTVNSQDGMIINLEALHHRSDVFVNPEVFNPNRFDDPKQNNNFYPFGKGAKSCVGRHLGVAEMKAILSYMIPTYRFKVPQGLTLDTLDTHWDIANQPQQRIMVQVTRVQPMPIILTGAHSTGKTTLLKEFVTKLNIPPDRIICESAREILSSRGWTGETIMNDKDKFIEFQCELLQYRYDVEKAFHLNSNASSIDMKDMDTKLFVADRGLDPLTYLLWKQWNEYDDYVTGSTTSTNELVETLSRQPHIMEMIRHHRACFNILIEPTEACCRSDNMRIESSLDELYRFNQIHEEQVLKKNGIPYLKIGSDIPLDKRVDYVLAAYEAVTLSG